MLQLQWAKLKQMERDQSLESQAERRFDGKYTLHFEH